MTDEVAGRGRGRSNSTSVGGGRNYYPQVDELVHANDEKFKPLTEKLTKGWILCLLRDTVITFEKLSLSCLPFTR